MDIDYKKFTDIYKIQDKKYLKLKKMVEDKMGTLLTDRYISATDKFNVKCHKNHIFETTYTLVRTYHWCSSCTENKRKTIEDMQEYAAQYGGKCLSKTYKNNQTKLKWECKNGHRRTTSYTCIQNSKWCGICEKNNK